MRSKQKSKLAYIRVSSTGRAERKSWVVLFFGVLRRINFLLKLGWKYYGVLVVFSVLAYFVCKLLYYKYLDNTLYVSFKLPDQIKKTGITEESFSEEITNYLKWVYTVSKNSNVTIDVQYASNFLSRTKSIGSVDISEKDAKIELGSLSFDISPLESIATDNKMLGTVILDSDSTLKCTITYDKKFITESVPKELKQSYTRSLDLLALRASLDIMYMSDPVVYLKYVYNMGDKILFLNSARDILNRTMDKSSCINIYRELSNYYYNENQLDSALKYIEIIEKADRHDSKIFCFKAETLLRQGDTERALTQLRYAITLNKDYEQPYFDIGDIYFSRHQVDSAQYYWNVVVKTSNYSVEGTYYALANKSAIYWQIGNSDSASYYQDRLRGAYQHRSMYGGSWNLIEGNNSNNDHLNRVKDIYEKNHNNKYACYYLGVRMSLLNDENHLDSAIYFFKKTILIDSKFTEGYFGLATIYSQQRDYILANQNYNKALKINGYNREIASAWINNLLAQGNYEEALQRTSEAMQSDGSNPLLYVLLARGYSGKNMQLDALYEFTYAYNLAPHDELVLKYFSQYLIMHGKTIDALNYINKLLEDDNKNWDAYNLLLQLGDPIGFNGIEEKNLRDMKEIFPDSNIINKRLAIYYSEMRRFDSCKKYIDLFMINGGDDNDAYWYKANSELELSNFLKAKIAALKLIDKYPLDYRAFSILGEAAYNMGDFMQAKDYYEKLSRVLFMSCEEIHFWELSVNELNQKGYYKNEQELQNERNLLDFNKLRANCNATTGPAANGLNR